MRAIVFLLSTGGRLLLLLLPPSVKGMMPMSEEREKREEDDGCGVRRSREEQVASCRVGRRSTRELINVGQQTRGEGRSPQLAMPRQLRRATGAAVALLPLRRPPLASQPLLLLSGDC